MKSKIQKMILVLIMICYVCSPLLIMAQKDHLHQENIKSYIEELNIIQNQIFTLAQKVVCNENADTKDMQNSVKNINKYLDTLRKKVNSELIEDSSIENSQCINRDWLMVDNALNYMKSALVELEHLSGQTSSMDRILTLERYFNFRIYATNTIRFISNLAGIK